jgi:hypothetical protein
MKFIIESCNSIEERLLTYISEECSFDMEPIVSKMDFELIVNKLSLTVIDEKIIQLWGFCGLGEWMKSNYQVPEYKKGILKVEHNLEFGFAYGINDEEFPVYVNVQTGWVCIGNPEKRGDAVEFINNCIAVIDDNKEFVSLWLKPKSLPNIE